MHTNIQTHTHTVTNTKTHTHIHTRMYMHTHIHTHMYAQTKHTLLFSFIQYVITWSWYS